MITVMPLGQSTIDWALLTRVAQTVLNRSILRPLDAKGITDRSLAEAIVAFGEFQQDNIDYSQTLRDAGTLLKHFSVSFLIFCQDFDTIAELAFNGDLHILDCDDCDKVFIVSANLQQWRTTIINLATPRATKMQRTFSRQVLHAFDKIGLSKLWENYSRSGGVELILTEKK